MSLLTGELHTSSLSSTLRTFEPRAFSFGVGRSLIAIAQFCTLAFTSTDALFQSILGQSDAPACVSVNVVSLFRLGGDAVPLWLKQVVVALLLLVVASGYRPRYTVVLHAWIAFSLAGSIALPDGGDQAARVMCLLFIPIGLADDRRWHWRRPPVDSAIRPHLSAVALAALIGLRSSPKLWCSAVSFGVMG
jgi:antimicrobial peptide system SdpB family protein